MDKQSVLKQITDFRAIGERDSAIDMWSKHKDIVSQAEFEEAYAKGIEIYDEALK